METGFSLTTLRRRLIWIVAFLIYCGFWAEVWDDLLEYDDPWELVYFFGLSYEENLPTWVASILLFCCSGLLAAIAVGTRQEGGPYVRHWGVLSIAFAYISLDEVAQLHENAGQWFDFGGALYFGWVIPASIVVLIFGLSYLRFLANLPVAFRNRFVLAGAIYVGGALGMELPLGYWTEIAGRSNFIYGMIDLVEESLELIGTSVFLYFLVEYLIRVSDVVRIQVTPARSA